MSYQQQLAKKSQKAMKSQRANAIKGNNNRQIVGTGSQQQQRSPAIGRRSTEDEFLASQKLDLLSFDASEEGSWSKDAKRLTKICDSQIKRWKTELRALKKDAKDLYQKEMWERAVLHKVEDKSSFPTLEADEHFKERHREIVMDTVVQFLLDATKCGIEKDSCQQEWDNLLDGPTREIVQKMQKKTVRLQDYINDAAFRYTALSQSKLANEKFAMDVLQASRIEMEKQLEFDRNRPNHLPENMGGWEITDEERAGNIPMEETNSGGGTGSNSPTLDDLTTELGEVVETTTTRSRTRAAGGTNTTSTTLITPLTRRGNAMVTPTNTTRSFGSSSPSPRAGGLLGFQSLRQSIESVDGEPTPQGESTSSPPDNTGSTRLIQTANIKMLTDTREGKGMDRKLWIFARQH